MRFLKFPAILFLFFFNVIFAVSLFHNSPAQALHGPSGNVGGTCTWVETSNGAAASPNNCDAGYAPQKVGTVPTTPPNGNYSTYDCTCVQSTNTSGSGGASNSSGTNSTNGTCTRTDQKVNACSSGLGCTRGATKVVTTIADHCNTGYGPAPSGDSGCTCIADKSKQFGTDVKGLYVCGEYFYDDQIDQHIGNKNTAGVQLNTSAYDVCPGNCQENAITTSIKIDGHDVNAICGWDAPAQLQYERCNQPSAKDTTPNTLPKCFDVLNPVPAYLCNNIKINDGYVSPQLTIDKKNSGVNPANNTRVKLFPKKSMYHFCSSSTQTLCQKDDGGRYCEDNADNNDPLPCPGGKQIKGVCDQFATAIGTIQTKPQAFIIFIFSLFLGLSGGLSLLIIIYSGYEVILSRGDAEKLKNARARLLAALYGLAFIVFALVLLQFVGYNVLHLPDFGPK